jgi:hypothetical protein
MLNPIYTPFWKEYRDNKFEVIVSPIVPMCDWDASDSAWHPSYCITFASKEDIIEFVKKEAHKRHLLLSLYKTKGGIHGICLNWQLPHIRAYRVQKPLYVDPVYQYKTILRGYVLRVSPKPNRPEAKPIHLGWFGRGRPLEKNIRAEKAHERLIDQNFL